MGTSRHTVERLARGSDQQEFDFQLVESDWEAPTELPDLRQHDLIAVDLETKDDGLNAGRGPGWPYRAGRIIGVAIATGTAQWYFPYDQFEALPRWLRDHSHVPQVFHNSPYDLGWLSTGDIGYPKVVHDTLAAGVCLDENRKSFALDNLAKAYKLPGKDRDLLTQAASCYGIKPGKIMSSLWRLPAKFIAPYAMGDVRATYDLFQILKPLLEKEEVWDAYRLECDLVPMVVDMRRRGIRVNISKVEQTILDFKAQLATALRALGDLLNLGRPFDIDELHSARRLQQHFDRCGVHYDRTDKLNVGKFESEWMRVHDHPLPRGIALCRSYREATEKFLSKYILEYSSNGRIHSEIHSFRNDAGGTRSFRFSYSDPPLQQMPGDRSKDFKAAIRGVFEPEEGEAWLSADWSQQEPRILVHYAALTRVLGWDEAVARYEDNSGTDYHQMVADLTGIPRPHAKIINLGIFYGMGKVKLAASLGISVPEATDLLNKYHAYVPFVRRLNDECQKAAQRRGYIRMLDGARRHFNMYEPAYSGKKEHHTAVPLEEAKRKWPMRALQRAFTHKAMNALVQGSAARQMKMAMREIYRMGSLPLLQLHDELCFSTANHKEVKDIIQVMTNVVQLRVPMKVDAELGLNWGEMTKCTNPQDILGKKPLERRSA